MNKRTMLRNKMMLGALTVADLREIVKIEGDYTVGSFWLPISRTRAKRGHLHIFMNRNDSGEGELQIPLNSLIKQIDGNVVRIELKSQFISCGYLSGKDSIEVTIRLYETPF